MIPIIIINGPLGSGKTTLIHSLLKNHIDAQKTLWLKTEFGDESIDEYVLQDTNVQTKSLTGGCICHVLLSELDSVLTQVEAMEHVDQIIIETSGMSHPVPVVQTIERHPGFLVAHTSLIVDTLHAGESTYPKPMRLPGGLPLPYDLIVFNKYKTNLSREEEGELEKKLDPWFDGVYGMCEKINIPDEERDQALFSQRIVEWFELLKHAMYAARIRSPRHIIETIGEESFDEEEMEDHEGDMEVLTFHIPANHIVTKEKVQAYVDIVPDDIIRIKGVFHTTSDTWEFFNWVRGTGKWTPLDVTPAGQILLVMGHKIAENADVRSIDV